MLRIYGLDSNIQNLMIIITIFIVDYNRLYFFLLTRKNFFMNQSIASSEDSSKVFNNSSIFFTTDEIVFIVRKFESIRPFYRKNNITYEDAEKYWS